MKVSIITPSRRRPAQLRKCIERLIETVQGHDVEIIVVSDGDKETALAMADVEGIILIVDEERTGAAACWNQATRIATGDAFVLGADDLYWGDGWLDAALRALDRLGGSGMIGFNDGRVPEHAFATHHLMTRDYIIDHMGGCFVIPVYKHQYIDLEATARARACSKYLWAGDCNVEHLHYAHHKAPFDETYRLGAESMSVDGELYKARMAAGWPDDFEPILTR